MKTISKKYLEKEIEDMRLSNEQIKSLTAVSPFGNAISDLEEAAQKYMDAADNRVRVQIWQKHRIAVLEGLLKELEVDFKTLI